MSIDTSTCEIELSTDPSGAPLRDLRTMGSLGLWVVGDRRLGTGRSSVSKLAGT